MKRKYLITILAALALVVILVLLFRSCSSSRKQVRPFTTTTTVQPRSEQGAPVIESVTAEGERSEPVVKAMRRMTRLQASSITETTPECNAVLSELDQSVVNANTHLANYTGHYNFANGYPTILPCYKDIYISAIRDVSGQIKFSGGDKSFNSSQDVVRVYYESPSPTPTPTPTSQASIMVTTTTDGALVTVQNVGGCTVAPVADTPGYWRCSVSVGVGTWQVSIIKPGYNFDPPTFTANILQPQGTLSLYSTATLAPLPILLKSAWPSTESKQNTVLANQWAQQYRFKRNLSGAYAEFEKVQVSGASTTVRKVAWPTTEGGQNTVVADQWKERYRFKRNLTGKFAEFELVP